jgi:hypothetical protein
MRPHGLVVLLLLVVVGIGVTAGYLQWKAPEVGRIVAGRRAEIAGAPQDPEGRLEKWIVFGNPQIHHRLELMRFSERQPWLVCQAVGSDASALEIFGIDLSDMPREIGVVEGRLVRIRLPAPRVLAHGALAGEQAAFVPVYPDPARVPDAVLRAHELARYAFADLGKALERDIPGATLRVEIGPQESWSAIAAAH